MGRFLFCIISLVSISVCTAQAIPATVGGELSAASIHIDSSYAMVPNAAYQGQTITDTIEPAHGFIDCFPINVSLQHGATIVTGTILKSGADTIIASFAIPSTVDTGSYDLVMPLGLNCLGDTVLVPHAFRVEAASITDPDVAVQGQIVTTTIASTIPRKPGCYPTNIYLQKDSSKIKGSIVYAVHPDTVVATFQIPGTADTGLYNIIMTLICDSECCNFDSIPNAIRIEEVKISMRPDSARPGDTIHGCLYGTLGSSIQSMYLRKDGFTFPVVPELRSPPCFPIGAAIPQTAKAGLYDLIIILKDTVQPDSIIVRNAFTVVAPAGVADNNSFSNAIASVHVFPNPSQEALTISFTMNARSHIHLILYDALGRTVATLCDRTLGQGPQSFPWTTDKLPAGSYFYELSAGAEIYGGKILVRH